MDRPAKGAYLYITGDEVVYANQKNVHLRLVGATKHPRVEGLEPNGGISSYFTGRDEKTWFTGIPHYAKLKYTDVYPGHRHGLLRLRTEHRIRLRRQAGSRSQANPTRLQRTSLDHGDLIVAGLRQQTSVFQDGREIAASYRIGGSNRVELASPEYDHSRGLIIDPVLEFSTYIGGPGFD